MTCAYCETNERPIVARLICHRLAVSRCEGPHDTCPICLSKLLFDPAFTRNGEARATVVEVLDEEAYTLAILSRSIL